MPQGAERNNQPEDQRIRRLFSAEYESDLSLQSVQSSFTAECEKQHRQTRAIAQEARETLAVIEGKDRQSNAHAMMGFRPQETKIISVWSNCRQDHVLLWRVIPEDCVNTPRVLRHQSTT